MNKDYVYLNGVLNKNNGTSLGGNFNVSWADFSRNIGLLVLFALLTTFALSVGSMLPGLGTLISGLLSQFITLGFAAYIYKERKGASQGFNDFFNPFNKFADVVLTVLIVVLINLALLTPTLLAGFYSFFSNERINNALQTRTNFLNEIPYTLLLTALISLPFIFYTSIVLSFAPYFAFFYNVKPVEAIKLSFKMGNKHFLHIFLLSIFSGVIIGLGFALCCVGALFAMPVAYILKFHSFSQITELEEDDTPMFEFEKISN